jgi:hypothetical protein|tara:strand:+ start:303 stop:476 length:174 start_codon:yes stop_codon:yes gene_type:complete
MTYTNSDYPEFVFHNPTDLRTGPEGEICDYQILLAPKGMESEISCWLALLTKNVINN